MLEEHINGQDHLGIESLANSMIATGSFELENSVHSALQEPNYT